MRLDNKQKNALFKAIEGIENEIYRSITGEFATELSNLKKKEIRF
jgi:hypothetical protein